MTKEKYLRNEEVQCFIDWVIPKINIEKEFIHSYKNRRNNQIWECHNIYNAFENYEWGFSSYNPITREVIKGKTFRESDDFINSVKKGLSSSLQNNDYTNLINYSNALLKWGGVTNSNSKKIKDLGVKIIDELRKVEKELDPNNVNLKDKFTDIKMNSGFTKIYSVLIPDFVIYDSRVGAALGLLVRKFLEQNNIKSIPETLKFAYGKARPTKYEDILQTTRNSRDPSNDVYTFPCLNNNRLRHIKNNIQANWLLKEMSMRSKFSLEKTPIRALECGLFMIGYFVRD